MPRNIRNDEFGPDSTKLPPPRPLSEHTEVTYIILKTRLLLVLREVMNLTNHNDSLSEEEIQKCELALSEAQATIPPYLKSCPAEEPDSASTTIQTQRIAFDRVYQLSRCMLYRKYLRRARTDPSVMQYRLSCIDAALKLLHHQATLVVDFSSMFSPSMNRRHKLIHPTLDFFVAGMVIALDLYYGLETESRSSNINRQGDSPSWVEMTAALETSNRVWETSKDDSAEAAKAYGIFSFVLQKVRNCQSTAENSLGPAMAESDARATEMGSPYNILRPPGDGLEFDWDNWNAYVGNDMDFETFLQ